MKQDDYIELIQPTPKLQTKKCKIVAKAIALVLRFSSFAVAIFVWWQVDLFFALVALAIAYLLTGIARSKMRTLSIPHTQLEYNYTDEAIATWYSAKRLCYENFQNNHPV